MVGALLLRSGLRFASRRSSAQQKRGITVTRCVQGVEKKITQEGNGPSPQRGQKVTVHYTGTLTSGKKFDSSRDRGSPFVFTIGVGQVIKGWDEGVANMKVGERAELTCSPDYAYGDRAVGGDLIPANSTLIFDVELLGIE